MTTTGDRQILTFHDVVLTGSRHSLSDYSDVHTGNGEICPLYLHAVAGDCETRPDYLNTSANYGNVTTNVNVMVVINVNHNIDEISTMVISNTNTNLSRYNFRLNRISNVYILETHNRARGLTHAISHGHLTVVATDRVAGEGDAVDEFPDKIDTTQGHATSHIRADLATFAMYHKTTTRDRTTVCANYH